MRFRYQSALTVLVLILTACGPLPVSPGPVPVQPAASPLTATPTPFQPVAATETSTALPTPPGPPPAVILFIGDGMGESQLAAGRWQAVGPDGQLTIDSLPVHGSARTQSVDGETTDSAAAATALGTGVKTHNGMLGQGPDGSDLTTILELAKARGLSTGLVTTTQITNATPAAFAVSVFNRELTAEVAKQLLETAPEVLLGGGEDDFLPVGETGCYPEKGKRLLDRRNLLTEAVEHGYTYVCTADELQSIPPDTGQLLGLFADEGMTRPFSPSLPEMTRTALEVLSQDPDGFFLMVEAGQIDWAAHDNDAEHVITDVLELDQAVSLARDFAAQRGNLLLIVTADHETGGMLLDLNSGEDGPFSMPDGRKFYVQWAGTSHTDANVPVAAEGPCSSNLDGVYENTHIHDVMQQALDGSCPPGNGQ
jgi:alkaline phosphatase